MSMQSWFDEFYPMTAYAAMKAGLSEQQLIALDARTYEGLSPENLAKHGLVQIVPARIEEPGYDQQRLTPGLFYINAGSSALCRVYLNHNLPPKDMCKACPIHKLLGRSCNEEYVALARDGDERPMQALLQRLKAQS